MPLMEKYWGGWKSGARRAGHDPEGAGAQGSDVRARAVDEPDAAVRVGGVSFARRSSRRARTRRRSISSARSTSARPPISTSGSSCPSRRWTSSRPTCRRASIRRCSRCSRGSRTRPTPCTSAIRSWRRSRQRARRWCPRRRWLTRSRTSATPSRGRSTAPSASPVVLGRYASYQRSYQHGQQLLPDARQPGAGRRAGGRAKVLHGRRADRDDAVEGPAASGHRSGAGSWRDCARHGLCVSGPAPVVGADRRRRRCRQRQPAARSHGWSCRSRSCRNSTSSCCSRSAPPTIQRGRKVSPRSRPR